MSAAPRKKAAEKKVDEEESEFGAGLVLCLVKFAEHFENDMASTIYTVHAMKDHLDEPDYLARYGRQTGEYITLFNSSERKFSGTVQGGLSHLIELWANGATDHLYELKVPSKWERTRLGRMVAELRDKGLSIGHGFTGKTHTFEDFDELHRLMREISHLVDIGLWAMMGEKTKLDVGQW